MLQRVWRCIISKNRSGEYEEFARQVSIAMFQNQKGYRGCIMARADQLCEVLTLWEDEHAITALETSDSYKAAVAAIRAAGFVLKEVDIAIKPVHAIEMIAFSGVAA